MRGVVVRAARRSSASPASPPVLCLAAALCCSQAASEPVHFVVCHPDISSCITTEEFVSHEGRSPDVGGDPTCGGSARRGDWFDAGSCVRGVGDPGGCAADRAETSRSRACPIGGTGRYRCVAGEAGPAQYEVRRGEWAECAPDPPKDPDPKDPDPKDFDPKDFDPPEIHLRPLRLWRLADMEKML